LTRRVGCTNNLRQMGLATQQHIEALGYLPCGGQMGGGECNMDQVTGTPYVGMLQDKGWTYQILPYIGQTALWQMKDDVQRGATALDFFFCPSRGRIRLIKDTKYGNSMRAMVDYAGNGGSFADGHFCTWFYANEGEDGPMTQNRAPYSGWPGKPNPVITPAHITKGLSVTVFLGEKCLNRCQIYMQEEDEDDGWDSGWDSDVNRWGMIPPMPDYNHAGEGGGGTPTQNQDSLYYYSFGSSHSGGGNYLMCDGSARPIAYSVSKLVFAYLCTRNPSIAALGNGQGASPYDKTYADVYNGLKSGNMGALSAVLGGDF